MGSVSSAAKHVKSQSRAGRVGSLTDLWLVRLDRQRAIPVVERSRVIVLLRVVDAQIVEDHGRRWLHSQRSLQLRNSLTVPVGLNQRRSEICGNGVRLREQFPSLGQQRKCS